MSLSISTYKVKVPLDLSLTLGTADPPVFRFSPKGGEDEVEIKWRKDFLRKLGYKL